jgi:hypothetical protein
MPGLSGIPGGEMKELLRTNDLVKLSWLSALLKDAGIESIVLDANMSVMEGSVGILQRRLMVIDDQLEEARAVLAESGEELPK